MPPFVPNRMDMWIEAIVNVDKIFFASAVCLTSSHFSLWRNDNLLAAPAAIIEVNKSFNESVDFSHDPIFVNSYLTEILETLDDLSGRFLGIGFPISFYVIHPLSVDENIKAK